VAHPYRIRDIAQQCGLSEATVDRVLNGRPGVRESTKAEVRQAIDDLDRQRTQLRLGGRTFVLDMVMSAPERFSSSVRAALEAELPTLRPAVVRSRFHLREDAGVDEVAAMLAKIAKRGSQGVILKAPDHPAVVAAVNDLSGRGIPVVTLVTDVPVSRRIGYVGIDNRAAGATAAYLITQWTHGHGGVLVTLSSDTFRGEEEREIGFRTAMRRMAPDRRLIEISGTFGLDDAQLAAVRDALERNPDVDSVYSIGGGNQATVAAFGALDRTCAVFVAHDLDHDNTALLRSGQLSAVLHHDLRHDLRRACRMIMQAHGALPGVPHATPSQIQVVTPFNEPDAFPDAG
jgi:LacI family transcriptional regulator